MTFARTALIGCVVVVGILTGCLDAGAPPMGRHLVTGRDEDSVELVAGAAGAASRIVFSHAQTESSPAFFTTTRLSTIEDPGPGGGATTAAGAPRAYGGIAADHVAWFLHAGGMQAAGRRQGSALSRPLASPGRSRWQRRGAGAGRSEQRRAAQLRERPGLRHLVLRHTHHGRNDVRCGRRLRPGRLVNELVGSLASRRHSSGMICSSSRATGPSCTCRPRPPRPSRWSPR